MGKATKKQARAERCGVCQNEVYFGKVPEGMADEQGDWIALEKREVFKYNATTQDAKQVTGSSDKNMVLVLHNCEQYADLQEKVRRLMDDNAALIKKVEFYEGGGVPAHKEGYDKSPEEPTDKPLPIETAMEGVCDCGHPQGDHGENGVCQGDSFGCDCWEYVETVPE